jgi:hypothetical protein
MNWEEWFSKVVDCSYTELSEDEVEACQGVFNAGGSVGDAVDQLIAIRSSQLPRESSMGDDGIEY